MVSMPPCFRAIIFVLFKLKNKPIRKHIPISQSLNSTASKDSISFPIHDSLLHSDADISCCKNCPPSSTVVGVGKYNPQLLY